MNFENNNEVKLRLNRQEYMAAKESSEARHAEYFSTFLREIGISVKKVNGMEKWDLIFKSEEDKTQFIMKYL